MTSQLPATTEERALPAPVDTAGVTSAPARRPSQNVTAGLYPIALGILAVAVLGLAFWTLMAVTGGGL